MCNKFKALSKQHFPRHFALPNIYQRGLDTHLDPFRITALPGRVDNYCGEPTEFDCEIKAWFHRLLCYKCICLFTRSSLSPNPSSGQPQNKGRICIKLGKFVLKGTEIRAKILVPPIQMVIYAYEGHKSISIKEENETRSHDWHKRDITHVIT